MRERMGREGVAARREKNKRETQMKRIEKLNSTKNDMP